MVSVTWFTKDFPITSWKINLRPVLKKYVTIVFHLLPLGKNIIKMHHKNKNKKSFILRITIHTALVTTVPQETLYLKISKSFWNLTFIDIPWTPLTFKIYQELKNYSLHFYVRHCAKHLHELFQSSLQFYEVGDIINTLQIRKVRLRGGKYVAQGDKCYEVAGQIMVWLLNLCHETLHVIVYQIHWNVYFIVRNFSNC